MLASRLANCCCAPRDAAITGARHEGGGATSIAAAWWAVGHVIKTSVSRARWATHPTYFGCRCNWIDYGSLSPIFPCDAALDVWNAVLKLVGRHRPRLRERVKIYCTATYTGVRASKFDSPSFSHSSFVISAYFLIILSRLFVVFYLKFHYLYSCPLYR